MAYRIILSIIGLSTSLNISIAATTGTSKNHNRYGTESPDKSGILDTSRVYDLDEVVIVSQPKEVMTMRRQPLSSTTFTGRDMTSLGAGSISDIAPFIPSFVMPAYGSRLTSSVYVRGIGSRVNNPAIGVYIDGIPLVSKNSYNFHTYQVGRVDVLRGPQGTLYGMNTEGGIVRLYSKDPMNYQGTEIHLGMATGLQRNAEAAHYAKIGNDFALSVAGFYEGQNGFFKNSTTGKRADGYNEAGAKAKLTGNISTRLKIDLVADYQYMGQDAFPYGTLDTGTRHVSDPSANRQNRYHRNMLNTGLTLTYQISDGLTLGSQTSYQYLRDRMNMDQDYLPQDYMHLEQRQLMNAVTQEFTLKSDNKSTWKHTSGLYGSYQWLRTEAPVYFDKDFTGRIANGISSAIHSSILQAMTSKGMPAAVAENIIENAGGISADVDMHVPARFHTPQANFAVFHESSINITDRLTAILGLRYDYNRVDIAYVTSAAMAVSANVMGTQATNTLTSALTSGTHNGYSQLLPKIGLSMTLTPDGSNVYAVASKGYRAGGYNIQMFSDILQSELNANSDKAMNGNYDIIHDAESYRRVNSTITYKPEESWNYELGAHLNLFDGKMHADIAGYYMTIRNQQLSVMASGYGFGRMMVNAGRSRSIGIEAALRGSTLDDKLQWAATYSFTSAKFTDYSTSADDPSAGDYSGKYIPYVPQHAISVRADLRLPLSRKTALTIGADLTGQGRTYWDEANTTSQPFYALLGLRGGLQWNKLELRLWCRNTTNTRYATFAFSSEASGEEKWFAQRGTPIQAGIDIYIRL